MKFILDTTTFSALMRGDRSVASRLLAERPTDVGVPHPVLAEIHYGIARLPKSRRRRSLEERLGTLAEGLDRVAWNDAVSRHFGAAKAMLERQGRRLDDFDLAIAAHALAYEATVVTDNLRHFERIPGVAAVTWSA